MKWRAGRLEQGIPLHEQTLTASQRLPGDEHPDTLNTANNLTYAYESAGRLGQAIRLYEQTLTDSRRLLGDEHPLTKTSPRICGGQEQRQTGSRVDAGGEPKPSKKRLRCPDRDP